MSVAMRRARMIGWALLALTLIAVPAGGIPRGKGKPADEFLAHLSGSVALRFWAEHPEVAPARVQSGLAALEATRASSNDEDAAGGGDVFNRDEFGLPQNEESITACKTNPSIVLGGTNDYRGLIDAQGNFTGWHFSNNGGRSLTNEGLLPPVTLLSDPDREQPSGGDPVDVAGTRNAGGTAPGCAYLYAASLAYNPADPFGDANGIAVYRSTPGILATCPTEYPNNSNPACWPTRRLVAEGGTNHFLDKEWFDVGVSGGAEWVWVTYSDFALGGPFGFTGAEIFAVRCDRDLVTCTSPIPISVDDGDVQFSDVTIAPDGRVYVTWVQVIGELPTDPQFPEQTFVIKMRVAEPGSIVFGPEQVVHSEDRAIPFGGFMHANDWRVATYPKNDVAMVGGNPRVFVVWDACKFRPLPTICEEALIKLRYSDNFGASWSPVIELSRGGDNYFPSIVSNDASKNPTLAFTWFTNRFDPIFHNRQDVEFMVMDPDRPRRGGLERLTSPSNESEADPLLGGFFIGDYIEVNAVGDRAWVHYNANYLSKKLLGPFGVEGIPVPQQDNFLVRLDLDDD
jgi:hypothetical protein